MLWLTGRNAPPSVIRLITVAATYNNTQPCFYLFMIIGLPVRKSPKNGCEVLRFCISPPGLNKCTSVSVGALASLIYALWVSLETYQTRL